MYYCAYDTCFEYENKLLYIRRFVNRGDFFTMLFHGQSRHFSARVFAEFVTVVLELRMALLMNSCVISQLYMKSNDPRQVNDKSQIIMYTPEYWLKDKFYRICSPVTTWRLMKYHCRLWNIMVVYYATQLSDSAEIDKLIRAYVGSSPVTKYRKAFAKCHWTPRYAYSKTHSSAEVVRFFLNLSESC